MKMTKWTKRALSAMLCLALLVSYIPLTAKAATGGVARSAVAGTVTDPGTAYSWEQMMGTDADGNRYAGRVWVDKSVYRDGDRAVLNTRQEEGSSFQVSLKEDEAFQIVFSALGSTMTTKRTVSSTGPMDVVLILDDSTSMDDIITGNTTRLEKLIEASNGLLRDLLSAGDVRIGIVAYNYSAIQILPFGRYHDGVELKVRNNKFTFSEYSNTDKGGTIQAFDGNGKLLYNNTSGYARGTNLQAGFDAGMQMLENAADAQGRIPVAIVLTDGASNTAVQNTFYDLSGQTPRSFFTGDAPSAVVLATLLTAAYKRASVENVYGVAPMIYGVGVDIADNAAANAMINPGGVADGFNSANSSSDITTAYRLYNDWLKGNTVRRTESYNGSYRFVFDHSYAQKTNVTLEDIANNIHYVDTYYPVAGAELSETFKQIYQELFSGVFNPISSSSSVQGGTGVDDTPLIYVDFIGQHMQIREIQAITLFGNSYGVVKNARGGYTVTEGTGVNPTTGEHWNTAQDIQIDVIDQPDGTQKLEIRINQQILPIIVEQVISETVGDVTVATVNELLQAPLRVYYTVGVNEDVLLPNGKVDVSKLQGYRYIDDVNGTVSFFSNQFGVMNPADALLLGDAHVGFRPSPENRYYYHQTNQGIFTQIRDESGKPVTIDDNDAYGILWDETKYDLTWMTYEEYLAAEDSDKVYTYVSYHRPTEDPTDAANAAEEVTYLVYTDWKYLKESVAFYDAAANTYLKGGAAIPQEQVADTVAAYLGSNPQAALYAVLGIGSMRTSRLHNMTVDKTQNSTQTAAVRYAPEYTHETAAIHNGNDVVVWLGNNGKLTVDVDTGIALTKTVTEPMGDPDDTYALTVTVPKGVTADPVTVDENGALVESTYVDNVLTVPVKAGQTVYISGIPGGTQCLIDEIIAGDYTVVSKTDKVRVPLVSEALSGGEGFVSAVVTNAPNKYGNLFITKEITSDHPVPQSILNTPFAITVNVGVALAGKTFAVLDSDHAAAYEVTADASGDLFFAIKARQTVEILGLPEGTPVMVTEQDPDGCFDVSYRTRNHSGEAADSDNALVIPANGSATAVVLNHYTPAPVSVELDLVIRKNFADETVAERLQGGAFEFRVEQYDGQGWKPIATETVTYQAGEFGLKSVTLTDVLKDRVFTQIGTYSYKVYEVKGDVTNISYDRTVYYFDVVVTDRGGQLEATVQNDNLSGSEYIAQFTNTYETAPVSMDIVKMVDNRSGDTAITAAGFRFCSVQVDANGVPLNPDAPETAANVIFSDAAGEARISGVYTKEQEGTHYYIVYEADDGRPGWTYSKAQYFVTVSVETDDTTGKLTAAMTIEPYNEAARQETAPTVTDSNKGCLFFTNTYDPQTATVDLDGAVSKELTGKTLEAGQFTFHVYEDGDRTAPVLIGTNDLDGNVHFVDFDKALVFHTVGKYQYDIVEYIPDSAVYEPSSDRWVLNGMRYDPTAFDLVVEVTNDEAAGRLVANWYFEDAVNELVTFHNSYRAAPTQYVLGGMKVLHGRAPRNGEFVFELYEGDTLLQTVTNFADGSFRFRAIAYTEAGTYTYTIKEAEGRVPGIRYDGVDQPVTVTVTVIDRDGVLHAAADISNTDVKFVNTYLARAAQVTFNGTKELAGGTLTDNSFTFHLYRTDSSFDVTNSAAQLLASTKNEDGAFTFEKTFDAAGTYYLVVLEDASEPMAEVVYDRTLHKFIVKIDDVGDGQLKATVTNVTTDISTGAAASVSTAVAFTNATFGEVTEKEVCLAGQTTTEIDGKKVNAGDVLTYFITYTNYTGQSVLLNIMDTIPNHTAYVEGSVSHNGAYTGNHLNWFLNVAAGRSITVSFDVTVLETEVIFANTAVVRDGVNTYRTNEVVNHTVEGVLSKDVFSAGDTTVSIDGKEVCQGEELLYKISFTNTSADSVDLTVTDKIPAYTTYVDGSADHNGVYDDGAVVWTLSDIPAWSTVTVGFRVTVNSDIGAVTVANQATATDGTNRYETRWVTNPVEEPPAPEKPPVPSIPKTGDLTGMQLWVTMLLLSCGGLVTVLSFESKKEETEA